MSDLFAGIQSYCDLRSRLCRIMPSVMAEGFAGLLRQPWNVGSGNGSGNHSAGSRLDAVPFAKQN
jgi:hypothetical protein